jgi:hypothetical protein
MTSEVKYSINDQLAAHELAISVLLERLARQSGEPGRAIDDAQRVALGYLEADNLIDPLDPQTYAGIKEVTRIVFDRSRLMLASGDPS